MLRRLLSRFRPRRKFTLHEPHDGDLLVVKLAADPRFRASIASWEQGDSGLYYTVVQKGG